MPLAQRLFGASADPRLVAFGGSSFGGICALAAAMRFSGRPEAVGGLLVESPSLWVAEGRFLREVAAFRGPWPRRLFVGMGSAEFSGTRPPPARPEIDAYMVRGADDLVAALAPQPHLPLRVQEYLAVGGDAGHTRGPNPLGIAGFLQPGALQVSLYRRAQDANRRRLHLQETQEGQAGLLSLAQDEALTVRKSRTNFIVANLRAVVADSSGNRRLVLQQ